jgi:5-enolpyruvylshikimate-3-phosphate synthase
MIAPIRKMRAVLCSGFHLLVPCWCAGATITGGTVTVEGCGSESLQGDVRFAEVMGLMGADVRWQPYSITITGDWKITLASQPVF